MDRGRQYCKKSRDGGDGGRSANDKIDSWTVTRFARESFFRSSFAVDFAESALVLRGTESVKASLLRRLDELRRLVGVVPKSGKAMRQA